MAITIVGRLASNYSVSFTLRKVLFFWTVDYVSLLLILSYKTYFSSIHCVYVMLNTPLVEDIYLYVVWQSCFSDPGCLTGHCRIKFTTNWMCCGMDMDYKGFLWRRKPGYLEFWPCKYHTPSIISSYGWRCYTCLQWVTKLIRQYLAQLNCN